MAAVRESSGSATTAACAMLAFGIMVIGQATPDARLTVDGVSLNALLFVGAACLALSLPRAFTLLEAAWLWLTPIAVAAVAAVWSLDPDYGGKKVGNLIASGIVALPLVLASVRAGSVREFARIWVVLLGLLLVAAVAYKLKFGFWDRQVNFLFNGPIVFGRLMGMGALLSLIAARGSARVICVFLFSLATVWTASKGPILALVAAYVWVAIRHVGIGRTVMFTAIAFAVGALLIPGLFPGLEAQHLTRLGALFQLADPEFYMRNYGSIGSRLEFIGISVSVIADNPLGVGWGGWSRATGVWFAEYPHNFFLEVGSEAGIFIGCLFVLPYFAFLGNIRSSWTTLVLFFAVAQQVSGDVLDSRFWLVFSLAALLERRHRWDSRPRSEMVPQDLGAGGASDGTMPAVTQGPAA